MGTAAMIALIILAIFTIGLIGLSTYLMATQPIQAVTQHATPQDNPVIQPPQPKYMPAIYPPYVPANDTVDTPQVDNIPLVPLVPPPAPAKTYQLPPEAPKPFIQACPDSRLSDTVRSKLVAYNAGKYSKTAWINNSCDDIVYAVGANGIDEANAAATALIKDSSGWFLYMVNDALF